MINMSPRKNILLIATGGTIASKKSDNGLKPQISPEELMQYIPQVKDICDFHAVQLLNLDSSNMEPEHWKMMGILSMKIMKNTMASSSPTVRTQWHTLRRHFPI